MGEPLRPVWAEVNLGNFKKNLEVVRQLVSPRAEILAVVKADAYGIGAVAASSAALQVPGVKGLAVATPEEAVELREAGLDCMILVLGPVTSRAARVLAELGVSMTVTSADGLRDAEQAGMTAGKASKVHIKVDTGMGRIGFRPGTELRQALELVSQLGNIEVEGLFSHFALAVQDPEYTRFQLQNFETARKQVAEAGIRPRFIHMANSAAILGLPEAYFDLVRPGAIIYGFYPSQSLADRAKLYPVVSLKARISHVKRVEPGTRIGYAMTYTVSEPAEIATLPLGYADGYPRPLSNKASVLVRGKRCPVAGRICMDQMMVDLKGQPGVKPGEVATLIGTDGEETISLHEVAELAGTIEHEILTGLGSRVPRVYIE
ncbi:MAG: alanine racemase [Bacillota bacterium]|jgi:alanine racemase